MLVFGSHVQTLFAAIMFCRTAALDLLLGFFLLKLDIMAGDTHNIFVVALS